MSPLGPDVCSICMPREALTFCCRPFVLWCSRACRTSTLDVLCWIGIFQLLGPGKMAMDVAGWLRTLGLEQYEPKFRENKIDVDVLPSLTTEDLKDLGVNLVGDRRRLLDAIAALRAEASPARNAAATPAPAATRDSAAILPTTDPQRRQLT